MSVPRTGFFLSLCRSVGIPLTAWRGFRPGLADGEHRGVWVAASLKQSFTGNRSSVPKPRTGATVEFSFAGSSELVTQLERRRGPMCSHPQIRQVRDKARGPALIAGRPVNFASNTLYDRGGAWKPLGTSTA